MRNLKNFIDDQNGAFAVIAAVVLFAVVAAAGVATDYSRVISERSDAQNALDSAVLAAAVTYQKGESKRNAEKQARKFLKSNWDPSLGYKAKFKFGRDGVRGRLLGKTGTTLLAVTNIKKVKWTIESAASFSVQPLREFSLAIDISSSMEAGDHMRALKNALLDFGSTVFAKSANRNDVAVTLVPFANGVSFPPEFARWLMPSRKRNRNNRFAGCFYDEPISGQASLTRGNIYKYQATPDLVLRTKSGALNDFCPNQETQISFFHSSQSTLNKVVRGLRTYQGTDTAEGMSWAWRSLDPNWRTVLGKSQSFPRDYRTAYAKAIVLLTDGMPYERPWVDGKVSAKEKAKAKLRELQNLTRVCNQIANDGRVDVYVIGYGDDMSYSQRQTLKACASGNGSYFKATARNLTDVFLSIAKAQTDIALTR